jgi:hypothetical protein
MLDTDAEHRGEPENNGPLTWPEGNSWIVPKLLERLGRRRNIFLDR